MIKDFLNKHSDDAISIATISIIVIAIIIVIFGVFVIISKKVKFV